MAVAAAGVSLSAYALAVDLFMQLRGVAACRGERWAERVGRRVRRDRPWPRTAKAHAIALRQVADLASDADLRERLAVECEAGARRWWERTG